VTAASRSRHSLYGTDDRIILDLGSKVWKVGFSGESAPRAVFDVGDGDGDADEEELWNYAAVGEMASTLPVGAQGAGSASTSTSAPRSKRAKERALERRMKRWLRRVYYEWVC
jgi:actin-related protein 10